MAAWALHRPLHRQIVLLLALALVTLVVLAVAALSFGTDDETVAVIDLQAGVNQPVELSAELAGVVRRPPTLAVSLISAQQAAGLSRCLTSDPAPSRASLLCQFLIGIPRRAVVVSDVGAAATLRSLQVDDEVKATGPYVTIGIRHRPVGAPTRWLLGAALGVLVLAAASVRTLVMSVGGARPRDAKGLASASAPMASGTEPGGSPPGGGPGSDARYAPRSPAAPSAPPAAAVTDEDSARGFGDVGNPDSLVIDIRDSRVGIPVPPNFAAPWSLAVPNDAKTAFPRPGERAIAATQFRGRGGYVRSTAPHLRIWATLTADTDDVLAGQQLIVSSSDPAAGLLVVGSPRPSPYPEEPSSTADGSSYNPQR